MLPGFLTEKLKEQYGDISDIIGGYTRKRRTTLRVNTLKSSPEEVAEALTAAGIHFEVSPFSPIAFLLTEATEKEIMALPLFAEGRIYLQSYSSMLPPLVLAPAEGDDILDMAAAPGGKTTQMAAMTGNRASITACERHPIRAEKLKHNLEVQGAGKVFVMVTDARQLDDFFSFGKILLDAPCSGSGTVFADDPNLEKTLTPALVGKCRNTQLALLKKAIRLLKKGGTLVYSTCSILKEENEEIVKAAIKGTGVEITPVELPGTEQLPLLPVTLPGTLCVRPTEEYEGFFVAKLTKM
ncbi:MAG: RsmB/NOP family class I SAM-dependent RNA methyltransferase [Clostridia bacterium]|nr:RsmB/NOP family class I SAM-dependent RNA methyltransferase [Clostridia bacterium]